jgi:serine/threonine-protein kinase
MVAIKVLDLAMARNPQALGRFRREIEAGRLLDHPTIIKVLDSGVAENGDRYMVMELLEGRSLRDVLHEEKRLVAPRAVRLAIQVTNALVEAHGRGIIHRDLKPENIFETRDGRVKVIDFGLVKFTEDDPAGRTLTRKGMTVGSIQYMAPEAIEAAAPDPRSDLYALGIILYECIAGEHPIPATNVVQFLQMQREHVPLHLSRHAAADDCPPGLADLVMRLLEKDPARRLPSARALLAALVSEQVPF